MRTDAYTKIMLTVIAACLVWIAQGGPSFITPVAAQNGAQSVVVVGWRPSPYSAPGDIRGLPLPITTDTNRR